MDIKKIDYFVKVVQYESFTKAARKLYVSQPILSRTVREIEDELSQTLINRTSKQFELTDKGKIFYEAALQLLEQHKQLETIFHDSNKSNKKELAVAGTGMMAAHIAEVFSYYGVATTVYGLTEDALKKIKRVIEEDYLKYSEAGYYSKPQYELSLDNIQYTSDKKAFENADCIFECITEDMDDKKAFLTEISHIALPDAIIASTTSGLLLSELSKSVERPHRFCGLHWMKPASIIPLVEIITTEQTESQVVEKLYDYLIKVKNIPVIINKEKPGFVAQRLQCALIREACSLVDQGVISMKDLDLLVRNGLAVRYMAMGIFEMMDWEGIDHVKKVCEKVLPDLDEGKDVPDLIMRKCQQSQMGIKTKEGFYSYPEEVGGVVLNNYYNNYYIIERLIYDR